MQSIVDFFYMVDDMLWGTPMVVIVLGTGIFLSLRFGFSYQRKLKFNIKNTFGNMTAAGTCLIFRMITPSPIRI